MFWNDKTGESDNCKNSKLVPVRIKWGTAMGAVIGVQGHAEYTEGG